MFVKINDSFVNPATIAAVVPHAGGYVGGVQIEPANSNRCSMITIGGSTIGVEGAAHHIASLLSGEKHQAEAV